MGRQFIRPNEIILEDLDVRLSSKGIRRLGTEEDNSIIVGTTIHDNIKIKSSDPNHEPYVILYGPRDTALLVRGLYIVMGMVFANIIAMNAYTAFELESSIFMLNFKCKTIKGEVYIVGGSLTLSDFI